MNAQDIIAQFTKDKAPIDPFEVARYLNVQIQENLNLANISDATRRIYIKTGEPCIWVNPHLTPRYRNYFFAGELGVLLNEPFQNSQDEEYASILEGVCKNEKFACDLLLPSQSVKQEIRYLLVREMSQMMETKYIIPLLAEKFVVPNFAVIKRLKYLGLISGARDEVIHDSQLN